MDRCLQIRLGDGAVDGHYQPVVGRFDNLPARGPPFKRAARGQLLNPPASSSVVGTQQALPAACLRVTRSGERGYDPAAFQRSHCTHRAWLTPLAMQDDPPLRPGVHRRPEQTSTRSPRPASSCSAVCLVKSASSQPSAAFPMDGYLARRGELQTATRSTRSHTSWPCDSRPSIACYLPITFNLDFPHGNTPTGSMFLSCESTLWMGACQFLSSYHKGHRGHGEWEGKTES